ncbi:MMPL family transporter, partial [Frankia sp. CcWB3]
ALFVLVAVPIGHLSLGVNDDRNLPPSSAARSAAEILRAGFDGRESSPLRVVGVDVPGPPGGAAVAGYAAALSRVDGVARVDAPDGSYLDGRRLGGATPAARPRQAVADAVYLSVVPAVEPISAEGTRLVRGLRAVPAPFPALVGGQAAERVDTIDAIASRAPLAGAVIALVTFVALFLMLGSIVVPLSALALNMLTMAAVFGPLVWIFQDGHLAGLLDVTATGSLPAGIPVLVFCVAFGVSMDYGVFLLSRVREEYDRTDDPIGSVATALGHTGRIVTFAALLLAVVFAGFTTSSVAALKLLGLGLALAVLLDAYVVRGLLVPSVLRLVAPIAWWAPGPLRRLQERIGLTEHARPQADPSTASSLAVPEPARPAGTAQPDRR